MPPTLDEQRARWDERYADPDYLWDVGPNHFVEQLLADAEPGAAIDLAAGEGRNAVWLAQQGWSVAAVDFSEAGLGKARQLAERRGVGERVMTVAADALTYQPDEPVDLVVIAYLQLPAPMVRTVLEHAVAWLRPGGRLFIVAHDRSNHEHGYGGPPMPDVLYDLDDTVAALDGLEIETAEVAQRQVCLLYTSDAADEVSPV